MGIRQSTNLFTPHSIQNLAEANGCLLPHSWQYFDILDSGDVFDGNTAESVGNVANSDSLELELSTKLC